MKYNSNLYSFQGPDFFKLHMNVRSFLTDKPLLKLFYNKSKFMHFSVPLTIKLYHIFNITQPKYSVFS